MMHSKRKTRLTVLAGGVGLIAALTAACSMGGCGAMDAGTQANDNQNTNSTCQYFLGSSPLSPEVADLVTLEVSYSGACSPSTYDWSATDPDGLTATLNVRNPPRTAELLAEKPGHYGVTVTIFDSLSDSNVSVSGGFTAVDPHGDQRSYLLRFTPPASSEVPRQQEVITVIGNTPMTGRVFSLEEGSVLSNTLDGPGGGFGAYLRLIQSGFPLYREVHVDSAGAFSVQLLANATYDVVVIPDDDTPAPALLSSQTLFELQGATAFELDAGTWVIGDVLDASALPVTGAQVGLRSGVLPSGIGTAGGPNGEFYLLARPGDQAVEIAPPEATGLPWVRIGQTSDLEVIDQTNLELSFAYAPLEVTDLSLRVVAGPAGSEQPVANARVTLEATLLPEVGTLTVTRDGSMVAVLDADGAFRVSATTGADGWLDPLAVPAGTYRVILESPGPQDVPAGYGTTVVEAFVVAGATQSGDVNLVAPWTLEGQIVDGSDPTAPLAGVRVIAMTTLGIGSAVETTTDASGLFGLEVVGGASYSVLVMPDPGSGLGRLRVSDVVVSQPLTTVAGEGPEGALVVPAGLLLAGQVTLQSTPVPGVLIQAIPSGVAGEPVLAEAVTGAGGNFEMVLPDPGVSE
jgi:hypothetical protein